MYNFISKCEEDTIEFAFKMAKKLEKTDIIVLSRRTSVVEKQNSFKAF